MSSTNSGGPVSPPAGFYQDGQGRERWWDGAGWTDMYLPVESASSRGPMLHSDLEVKREVSYVRNQTPHSLTMHLLFGWIVLWIPTIYYAMSPNHYFRL